MLAHWESLLPLHSILVLLACGSRGGANGVEDEVWVLCEEEDEALADGSCAAQYTCEFCMSYLN